MSRTAVLTALSPAEPECPSWCVRESAAEATGSHVSTPVELRAPDGADPGTDGPVLSVRIGLGHDEQARGDAPRIWLSTPDGTAQVDSAALGELCSGLEHFALRLRGLRHRFDAVVRGGVPESVNHYPTPVHALELVAPCPPWCQYREEEPHSLTGLLRDYFHAAHEQVTKLELQPLTRTKDGVEPETLEIGMSHMPCAPLPQIDLTVGGPKGWRHVALTFAEADELRAQLSDFLAQGAEYAPPPGTVPTCQELVDYCGARIVETDDSAPGFCGYAVGDTQQGGPVWVSLPCNLTRLGREERIAHLLAEVHEVQEELVAKDGGEFVPVGRPPGAPTPLVVAAAA
ncbi:DUF6907 domain-containing protein [Streptomyces sp. NPDC048172]|uniref:DUF6907 domain-containing protein n=1 Tax=Streptomyces sp. NPDC048172 TaxID=3365505 RepID=UPI00371AD402